MAVSVGNRHIKDTAANRMFYAVDAARLLAVHTIKICSNEKVFIPKFSHITDQIVAIAMEIYSDAWTANNIRVNTVRDWEERSLLQKKSIAKCYGLLGFIDLAKLLFHLRANKVEYWGRMTINVRELIRAWHEKDRERYNKKLKIVSIVGDAKFAYPIMEAG